MDISININIFNFNASRCTSLGRIQQFYEYFEQYDPTFVCVQEIGIISALKVFSDKYQVFVNQEPGASDGIGIATLVKKGIKITDVIIGQNGRIIGLKFSKCAALECLSKIGVST